MSSYVSQILGPDERILYEGHLSAIAILPALIGGILFVAIGIGAATMFNPLGIIVAVPGLLWIGAALVRRSSTELAVTNRRVIAKFGFIRRSTVEMNLAKIESVRVEQSVPGRIFGYGSIYVVGTGSTLDPIAYIGDPIRFRQAIMSATDDVQQRSGSQRSG